MTVTKFTVEGPATLGYFTDRPFGDDRTVHIKTSPDGVVGDAPPVAVGSSPVEDLGKRVEQLIAAQFEFPNDAEFLANSEHMDQMRELGVRPAEGVPSITREGLNLRITVEIIEN